MNTYIWNSEAFGDYSPGTIIAMGDTVEDARKRFMVLWRGEMISGESYYEHMEDELLRDLSKDPVSTNEAYIVWGGG